MLRVLYAQEWLFFSYIGKLICVSQFAKYELHVVIKTLICWYMRLSTCRDSLKHILIVRGRLVLMEYKKYWNVLIWYTKNITCNILNTLIICVYVQKISVLKGIKRVAVCKHILYLLTGNIWCSTCKHLWRNCTYKSFG